MKESTKRIYEEAPVFSTNCCKASQMAWHRHKNQSKEVQNQSARAIFNDNYNKLLELREIAETDTAIKYIKHVIAIVDAYVMERQPEYLLNEPVKRVAVLNYKNNPLDYHLANPRFTKGTWNERPVHQREDGTEYIIMLDYNFTANIKGHEYNLSDIEYKEL